MKLRMDSHQKFPSVKEKKKKERQEVDLGFIEVTDVLNGESTAKMILDSGCSHHIAGEHFEKYITERTSGQERVVKTACGTLRRSSTYVVLEIPLKKTDLTLRNILYIPGFGGMYVSIGQLMKKNENIKIEMTGEDMVVSQEANNVVLELFRGTLRGSIYVVDIPAEAPKPSPCESIGCAQRIQPKEEPLEDEVEGKSTDKPESSDEVEPKDSSKKNRRKKARRKRTKKPQTDDEKARLAKMAMDMHVRYGHINAANLRKICKDKAIEGIPHQFLSATLGKCQHCVAGKMKRKVKGKSQDKPNEVGDIVFADSSPGHPSLPDQRTGFQIALDGKSSWRWVNVYKRKTENPDVLLSICRRMKNQGRPVKKLRTDNAGEYKSKEFREKLEELGIEQEFSAPRCQYQNPAERQIGLVHDTAATFLSQSGLKPEKHWADAVKMAVYTLNRIPTQTLDWRSPFEIMMGKKPKANEFHPFGCLCFKHDETKKGKFYPKGNASVYLGPSDECDGFILMRLRDGRRTTEKNVTFFDDTFPYFKDFVNRDIEISEDHVVITFPSLPVAPALNVEREIPNSGGNADQNENPASHAEKVEENLSTPTSSSPTPMPTTPTLPSTDENPKEDDLTLPSTDENPKEDDLTLPSTDESPEEDESQPPDIDIPDTNDQAEEAEPKPGGVFIPTGNPKYHQAKFFDDFEKLGDERERRCNAVKLSTTESEYYAISEGMRVVVWMKNSMEEIAAATGLDYDILPVVKMDSKTAIDIIRKRDPEASASVRHMKARVHWIFERFDEDGDAVIQYVESKKNLSDIMTKSFGVYPYLAQLRDQILTRSKDQGEC